MDLEEKYSKDRKKMREASISVLLQAVDGNPGMLEFASLVLFFSILCLYSTVYCLCILTSR